LEDVIIKECDGPQPDLTVELRKVTKNMWIANYQLRQMMVLMFPDICDGNIKEEKEPKLGVTTFAEIKEAHKASEEMLIEISKLDILTRTRGMKKGTV